MKITFKDKFQKRRLSFSFITVFICQLPTFYFETAKAMGIGMIVGNVIIWTVALIAWNDDKNKWWITRYFDPS